MEHRYEDLGWRTPLVVVCLLINIVLSLASAALAMGFDENDPNMLIAVALVPAALGGIATFIASIVAVCLWTYRANANAHVLAQAADWVAPSLTPGSAVGSYFIPFVNLVRPYTAMREIDSAGLGAPSTDPMLGVWWGTWVVGNILGNIGFRMDSAEADLGGAAAHFVSGILLALIVRRIHDQQRNRDAELRAKMAPSVATFREAPAPAIDPAS